MIIRSNYVNIIFFPHLRELAAKLAAGEIYLSQFFNSR